MKEKLQFAKGYEQTFSTEIFCVVKVIKPVYVLTDLQSCPIKGQFYNYEHIKVTVSPVAEHQIDKTVCTHNKGSI
jgi:hypothetical protein